VIVGYFKKLARHLHGRVEKDSKEFRPGQQIFELRTFGIGSTRAEKTWRVSVTTTAQLGDIIECRIQGVS
jgi:hypothetical protein